MLSFFKKKTANASATNNAANQNRGFWVEQQTKAYLLEQGLNLVAENYHSRFGEIDLILTESKKQPQTNKSETTLLFIEVRYRANSQHGSGAESVSIHKQRKIIKTAQAFLQKEAQYAHLNCRFDVISVCPSREQNSAFADKPKKQPQDALEYHWFKDAFQASAW